MMGYLYCQNCGELKIVHTDISKMFLKEGLELQEFYALVNKHSDCCDNPNYVSFVEVKGKEMITPEAVRKWRMEQKQAGQNTEVSTDGKTPDKLN